MIHASRDGQMVMPKQNFVGMTIYKMVMRDITRPLFHFGDGHKRRGAVSRAFSKSRSPLRCSAGRKPLTTASTNLSPQSCPSSGGGWMSLGEMLMELILE